MPSIRLALALALCLPFIAGEVHSQNPATRIHETPSPVVKAIARNGSVTIDGSLNESAWSGAGVATGFVQLQPSEGKPVTQNTEVRFLYDAAALYIGARMYDSLGAKGVKGDLVRRDRIGGRDAGDYVQFVFDTFHDHLSRTIFTVNPAGVKGDAVGPGGSNPDNSWDPVWEVATKIDSLGWTAEFRIPLNQIRFSAAADQTWGVQIWRFVSRINEIQMYSYWKSSDIGGPSRFAHLED
ncbi:MAG: carbohydrate binding family 9 domain-containing protein [Gemmatimonadota bacterium]|nr:carbohydrate binding family 9 domain-containing protein [Gemmatimonadota bacterium]